jgi:hypothetical protein
VMDGSSGGIILAGEAGGGEYSQDYASSGTVVEQNILSNASAEYNVQAYWGGPKGTNNVVRSNCVYGGKKGNIDMSDGGFTPSNNLSANPRYADRASRDYRLASDSPCLPVVGYDTAAKLAGVNAAPKVRITSPAAGTTFTTQLCPEVSASDDRYVDQVRFYLDGVLKSTDQSGPWSACFDTSSAGAGSHTLRAVAYDGDGARGSGSISVTK